MNTNIVFIDIFHEIFRPVSAVEVKDIKIQCPNNTYVVDVSLG